MELRIQLPEVFVLSSTALFCFGINIHGWIFFSLGLLPALFRMGQKIQDQQKQNEIVQNGVDVLKDSAESFLKSINDAMNMSQAKNKTHLN